MPANKVFDGIPAVNVHRHGSGEFTAFDDGFIEKQVGDGGAVLIDIADLEAEQLADAAASRNTEHKQSAIARRKRAIEACPNESDFIVVEGSCAFHCVCPLKLSKNWVN